MDRILLIDDDVGTLEGVGLLLRMAPYEVVGARTGQAGVLMAKEVHPTFAFIDLKLPDMSGLDVLRELRVGVPDTRCIIVTGFGSCKSVVEALRLGACDYLEKPLSADDLVESMKKALVSPTPNEFLSESQQHSLCRWAAVITRTTTLQSDPRTLFEWGRGVGASQGALRNWCRTARLSARRSLLFARVLRAVLRRQFSGDSPENLLNIVDRRTLAKVLQASGGSAAGLPESVDEFLDRQRLIEERDAVEQIRRSLASVVSPGFRPPTTIKKTSKRSV